MSGPAGTEVAAFREAVERCSPEYGLALGPDVVDRFAAHYELLVGWNRRLNLTRITAPDEAARRHFLESAFLTTLVEEPAELVDVGSGAGFPGLPLACVWGAARATLVEPNAKRCVFLKEAVRATGVGGVRVVEGRFAPEMVPEGALLVSRALEGFEGLLGELIGSRAGTVALFAERGLLERGLEMREGRIVALPASDRRMVGVFHVER